jgi:hypothetical protein
MIAMASQLPGKQTRMRVLVIGFGLGVPALSLAATLLGFAPAIGDPQPGQLRRWLITVVVFVIPIVATSAALLYRRLAVAPRFWLWPLSLAACLTLAIYGSVLIYHSPKDSEAYIVNVVDRTTHVYSAAADPGRRHRNKGALLLLAAPFVALGATGFRRGSSRIFVIATATASLVYLISLILYALNHL